MGMMTADQCFDFIGMVPKEVYIYHGPWTDATSIQCAANSCWEGVQMEGKKHPGFVVLEHHSSFRTWYAIVNRDLAKEGVFPTEYMVVSQ
jgi:hypothetical protein